MDEARARAEEQTARNLRGMELEREGQVDAAMALYEQNVAEGFAADWPYGRLVAIYERLGRPEDALRVLERGLAVFKASRARTPEDHRAVMAVFRNRMRKIRKEQDQAARGAGRRRPPPPG